MHGMSLTFLKQPVVSYVLVFILRLETRRFPAFRFPLFRGKLIAALFSSLGNRHTREDL